MIETKMNIIKIVKVDNKIKFVANKNCFEIVDYDTKDSYDAEFNHIFPDTTINRSLIKRYYTFLKILIKFNEGLLCLEKDDYPDNAYGTNSIYDEDSYEVKQFIDDYGELLFTEILEDARFNNRYRNVEIEYVGLNKE